MATPGARLAVIGCGNPARCDDGVGIAVVQALRRRGPPDDVELVDAGTGGIDVMFRVRGAQRVVIVDACRSGSEPGAVFRLPAREAMTPIGHGYSLHGLRWDHALFAGSKMFGEAFADHTEVVLVEAQDLGFGLDLSPRVRAAAAQVVEMLAPLVAGDG
ncbi:MAG: hydrogenase maturation protease [Pseudomonadota bacterium]